MSKKSTVYVNVEDNPNPWLGASEKRAEVVKEGGVRSYGWGSTTAKAIADAEKRIDEGCPRTFVAH